MGWASVCPRRQALGSAYAEVRAKASGALLAQLLACGGAVLALAARVVTTRHMPAAEVAKSLAAAFHRGLLTTDHTQTGTSARVPNVRPPASPRRYSCFLFVVT